MDQDMSLDIQHIFITDDQSPSDVSTQLQLDIRLPEGRKTREELLKSPALQPVPGKDQKGRINSQFVFYGQCLVLGDSGAGKTSLVKSLTGEPFDHNQAKTQGIDQRLVDERWKKLDVIKDLKFGNFSPFFEEVLVQFTFVGKAANISYQGITKLYHIFLVFHFAFMAIVDQSSFLARIFLCSLLMISTILTKLAKPMSRALCAIAGYLLRSSACLRMMIGASVIGNHRLLTIGAFLSVMTKCFSSGILQSPQLETRRMITFCFAAAILTVGVLVALAALALIFLFRGIRLHSIERKCQHPGQYKVNFAKIRGARELISFGGFVIGVGSGYLYTSCFILLFMPTGVSACNFAMFLAFIWHVVLAFESIPRLSGRWQRKACNDILTFVIFSFSLILLHVPPNIYFVIIYTTFFCDTLYVKYVSMKFPVGAGDSGYEEQDTNMFAAFFIEKAVLNQKKLKSELNRKYSGLKLKILDFAGDREYYSYHYLFLRHQAIYIIVFNMEEFVHDDFRNMSTGIQRLQFWIESVCSHVPHTTPIFLVGTHRGSMDNNSMKILDDHLRGFLWRNYCDELVVNDADELIFFPVENFLGNKDTGIQALQREIMSVAEQNKETMGRDIPLSWIQIQDAIISLKESAKSKSCVTLDEFPRTINSFVSITCSLSKETLEYFHEKGLIIYVDKKHDLDLSNWILLKPEKLVDITIELLTPPPGSVQCRGLRHDWDLLQRKGILTKALLQSIIAKLKENEEAITAFLEEYDLICPLVHKKIEMQKEHDHELQPTHFVPSLLPMCADGDVPAWHDNNTDKKFYVFFHKFLPEPLFHRLLSRAHKNSKVDFPNGETVLYRDVCKIWMNPWLCCKLKLMGEQKMIEVTYSSSSNNRWKPSDVLCQVFAMVNGIRNRDFPFVKFHCGPACPSQTCPGHQEDYLTSIQARDDHGSTRRCHVYNVMPAREGDRTAFLYCENRSFENELEEWIP